MSRLDGAENLAFLIFFLNCISASAVFNIFFSVFNSPVAAFALVPLLAMPLAAFPSYRHTYRCACVPPAMYFHYLTSAFVLFNFQSAAYEPEQQASIFSAVSVLEAVPSIIAPLIYNQIYVSCR